MCAEWIYAAMLCCTNCLCAVYCKAHSQLLLGSEQTKTTEVFSFEDLGFDWLWTRTLGLDSIHRARFADFGCRNYTATSYLLKYYLVWLCVTLIKAQRSEHRTTDGDRHFFAWSLSKFAKKFTPRSEVRTKFGDVSVGCTCEEPKPRSNSKIKKKYDEI